MECVGWSCVQGRKLGGRKGCGPCGRGFSEPDQFRRRDFSYPIWSKDNPIVLRMRMRNLRDPVSTSHLLLLPLQQWAEVLVWEHAYLVSACARTRAMYATCQPRGQLHANTDD